MSVLAIIPARAGSKGIPGKNFKPLAGLSPVARAVRCACAAGLDDVIVSTDALASADAALPTDARVRVVARPPALATDTAPMIDVVKHVLAEIPGPDDQIVVLLQPTQPLREPEHITRAIALLQEGRADSVVSVVRVPHEHSPELTCWIGMSGYLCPFDVKRGLYGGEPRDWSQVPARRQDAGRWYCRDGTVYAFRRSTVVRHGTIYGNIVLPLIIDPSETCALDTPSDWAEAEMRLIGSWFGLKRAWGMENS